MQGKATTTRNKKMCPTAYYSPGRAPLKCGLPYNHAPGCCDVDAGVAWRDVSVVTPGSNGPKVVWAMRMREADGSLHAERAELGEILAADTFGRALAAGDSVSIYRPIKEGRWGVYHNETERGTVVGIEGWDEITVDVAGERRRMTSNVVTKIFQ